MRTRESLGLKLLLTRDRNSEEITRRLREGEAVTFVADVDARQHGTFVDFFGESKRV